MIGGTSLSVIGLATAGALAAAAVPQPEVPAEASAEASGEALGTLIEGRLRAGGPFFTAQERTVIDRACGYETGEWDGFQVNINDGILTCANGRRADSPEVRAVLAAAEPRIEARVQALMASPEITEAIAAIAEAASAEALRNVDLALADLEDLDIDVDVGPGDGVDVDVDVDDDADDEN
ncbi:MAG TPA: hypothetical protein VLK25_13070 [Allosphingosinicella sp.]|nr:hypothetical protein [Allosphingosinicella sp.]